jgi:hypothetical protein
VHKRVLTVLAVTVFVLTLLIVVAAGAQEKSTDASASPDDNGGGGGIQVQQQDQQVQAQDVQTQAQGCRDQRTLLTIGSETKNVTKKFNIEDDKFRVSYKVTFNNNNPDNKFTVEITEGSKKVESNSTEKNVTNRSFTVNEGSGEFKLETTVKPPQGAKYSLTIQDCRGDNSNNNHNNNNHNNNNHTYNTVAAASAHPNTTGTSTNGGTTSTASPAASSATPAAETTTANNASGANPNSGNFRCESFLRQVRGDNGALKNQYNGNQLFEHRFQQCLSGNVLTNTIPNRNLPFTGGMSLIALVAIGLAPLLAGAAVLRAMMRRGGR